MPFGPFDESAIATGAGAEVDDEVVDAALVPDAPDGALFVPAPVGVFATPPGAMSVVCAGADVRAGCGPAELAFGEHAPSASVLRSVTPISQNEPRRPVVVNERSEFIVMILWMPKALDLLPCIERTPRPSRSDRVAIQIRTLITNRNPSQ
ncbi:MAG: hypothetical protein K2X32_11800 [Phycisphaerales bacterium]|nr:hypothetical protein [Phycisphaerales bacterium]